MMCPGATPRGNQIEYFQLVRAHLTRINVLRGQLWIMSGPDSGDIVQGPYEESALVSLL